MFIPFGEFLPDEPLLENPGMPVVTNVLPRAARGYTAMRDFGAISNALAQNAIGAYASKTQQGTGVNYVGGATKIYQLSGQDWLDVTRASGDYASGLFWRFAEWDQYLFATNYEDKPQFATLSSGGLFDDVYSGDILRAKHVGVVGNFVVWANTVDTDGTFPNRVRWSGLADPFTITPDPVTQSDFQNLRGPYGAIQAVVGGEWGILMQERGIQRMDYVGGDAVFTFDPIEGALGTNAPLSVIKVGPHIYYLAIDGFRRLEHGVQSVDIGEGKIDRQLLDRLPVDRVGDVRVAPLPQEHSIVWYGPTKACPAGCLDNGVALNYVTEKWTYITEDDPIQLPFQGVSNAASPDDAQFTGVSADDLAGSPDDPIWAGGVYQLTTIDGDRKYAVPNLFTRTAAFETPEKQFTPGRRSYVERIRPVIEGALPSKVQVLYRNSQSDSVVVEDAQARQEDGTYPLGSEGINARYIRFRIELDGEFQNAMGVELEAAASDEL